MVSSSRAKMRMLLGSVAGLICLLAQASAAEILTGAAAWRQVVGNTIVIKTKLGSTSEYFEPSGVIRHRDEDGATKGAWSEDNGTVCFDYPDDDDRVCGSIEVTGTNGRFTDAGGTVETFDILAGNPNGL